MKEANQAASELAEANQRLEHLNRVLKAIRNVSRMIVVETDPERLIGLACENLTETMGYHNAWIALLVGDAALQLGLPETGPVPAIAAAGFENGFEALQERLVRGNFPKSMKRALESGEMLVLDNPLADCPDCSLHDEYSGRAGLVRRLDFDGITYGILTVSVPAAYARDAEEQDLFNEVAGDISFALNRIVSARKLEENCQYLGLVIEGSEVGTWEWNVQTNKTRFNEQWAAMLGYTIEELTPYDYRTWERLVHPDDIGQARKALSDCIAGKTADYSCEFRMKHKDGRWIWILDRGRIMTRDEAGKALSMFGMHTDITDIKQAQQALEQSEQRYRGVVEDQAELISRFRFDGTLTWVNEFAAQYAGQSLEELVGRSFLEFLSPEEQKKVREDLRKITVENPVVETTQSVVLPSGETRWLQWRSRGIFDEQGAVVEFQGVGRDITEQKQAEEALRESEKRLQLAMESATEGVWEWDFSTGLVTFDAVALRMIGYEADFSPRSAEWWFEQLHADDRSAVEKAFTAFVSGETPKYGIEFRLAKKGGDYVWVASTARILRLDEEGKPLLVVGIHRDITERKQAEEALRKSESLFQAMLTAIPDMISIHDTESNVVYSNWNGFAAIPSERRILGEKCYRLYRGLDKICPDCRTKQVIRTRKSFTEEVELPEGGWFELNVVPILDADGNCELTVEWVRDITERKFAEAEHERLNKAIEQSNEVIVITDVEGRIQYVNPAFKTISGYDPDEVKGCNPRILKSGKQSRAFYCELWKIISSGKTWKGKIVNKRKDGSLYTEEATISPVFNADGEIVNYVAVKRDVSEQLRLEAQLLQSQKMESVGRLAGGVAHDFNNMLSVIIGHADMMLDEMEPDQQFYNDLMEIKKAGVRSADLTRQLLAFARRQTVTPKVIDLDKTVSGMLNMLKRLIGEHIEMSWVPGWEVWPVKIDPSQVDQILVNLCVNARDAITGVGRVTIETGNTVLDEEYCRAHAGFVPGEYVKLSVSDNGIGMDSETVSHLFEPFYSTKELGKGTGLGLSTVYGAVKQNNGFINVYSEPEKGTTFIIYLPRHKAKATSPSGKSQDKPVERGHETVLLVEDETVILRMATMMLERQGYSVLGAPTPGEALRLAKEHAVDIDLLITDIVMPEMNGRDLAKNILSLYPDIKCLFMSAYTENVIAQQGLLDGNVNFLHKPFSKDELCAKVRDVLDQK